MLRAFDDGRIFGAAHGDADPWVLALHGWQRTHHDFDEVLGTSVSGLAVDLPGFGASPPPPRGWGSAEYARAVEPVLSQLRLPAVVVGHSFGGRVAVHLAASRPGAVRAVVLSGVPQIVADGRRRRSPALFRLVRRLHRAGLLPGSAMQAARTRYGSRDYRVAQGVMREVLVRVLRESYEEQLSALRCPAELVWGAEDTAAPPELAEAACRIAPSARLTVLQGVGHLVPTLAPGQLRSAIEAHRP